ncbi:hypothetical protein LTR22_027401 [Elasticomyces elasticus]|nr:hypothetical protein LTR22_027401 [Elasticomyces elasticus]
MSNPLGQRHSWSTILKPSTPTKASPTSTALASAKPSGPPRSPEPAAVPSTIHRSLPEHLHVPAPLFRPHSPTIHIVSARLSRLRAIHQITRDVVEERAPLIAAIVRGERNIFLFVMSVPILHQLGLAVVRRTRDLVLGKILLVELCVRRLEVVVLHRYFNGLWHTLMSVASLTWTAFFYVLALYSDDHEVRLTPSSD